MHKARSKTLFGPDLERLIETTPPASRYEPVQSLSDPELDKLMEMLANPQN